MEKPLYSLVKVNDVGNGCVNVEYRRSPNTVLTVASVMPMEIYHEILSESDWDELDRWNI